MAALDIAALQGELEALRKQRIEAKERLDATRAPPPPAFRPPPIDLDSQALARGVQRPRLLPSVGQRPVPGGDGYRLGEEPAGDPRSSSRVDAPPEYRRGGRHAAVPLYQPRRDLGGGLDTVGPSNQHRPSVFSRIGNVTSQLGRDSHRPIDETRPINHEMDERRRDAGQDVPLGDVVVPSRKRVLSAVVVDESVKLDATPVPRELELPAPLPRPSGDEITRDPTQKKRARRMFGALMGTLQKFKDEDAQHQATAQRRADISKRAEIKQAELVAEARRAVAAQRAEDRRAQLEHLSTLNLATSIKALELATAQRLARRALTHGGSFLLTAASPPLLWVPAQHCDMTLELQQQRKQAHAEWEASMLVELEAKKARLTEEHHERRSATKARAEAIAAARASSRDAASNGHAKGSSAAMADDVDHDNDVEQGLHEDEEMAGVEDAPATTSAAWDGTQPPAEAVAEGPAQASASAPAPAAALPTSLTAAAQDGSGIKEDVDMAGGAAADTKPAADEDRDAEEMDTLKEDGAGGQDDAERPVTVEDLIMG